MTANGRFNASMHSRRNGTTHVEWDPVDFIAKLAALVPPPRAHLTRFKAYWPRTRTCARS